MIGVLLAAVVVLAVVAIIGLGAPPAASPSGSVPLAPVAPPPAGSSGRRRRTGDGPDGFVDCGRIPADACARAIALARVGNEAALIDTTHVVVDDICAPDVMCDRMFAFDSLVVFVTAGADFTGWRRVPCLRT